MLSIKNSVLANSASRTNRYRPEIDGLRAFAVVAVIINHFNKNILPGGYLGVDIFFVISGYVITSSLLGRPSKDFKDFISGFYERRIKRLVPALSAFVLITSIAICLFNPSPDESLQTGVTSLFGISNLYLLKQSTDYFAQSTELNVFTHTWSLGVEEQFYILFPFLIWFSGFGRQTKHGARNLFLIVGALTIASIIGFLYLYPTNQSAAYFLMPSRFWEMAAGCLIFIGFQKKASIEQLLEHIPPLLVLALIVGVMYLPMSYAAASTTAVVALSSILIASLKKQTAAFKVFTHPRVVYIGLISYSLYLWHWGVLSISRWTIGIHWWSVPFQIALMLGLAIGSYRWVETPLRKKNWFGKRWKTLVIGGSSLLITALLIEMIPKTPAKKLLAAIGTKIYPPAYLIKPGIPQSDLYCHLPKNIQTAFQDCLSPLGSDDNSPKISLVGDSHASNHHWSIQNALKKTNSNFTLNTLIEWGYINYLVGNTNCEIGDNCIKNSGNAHKLFFRDNLQAGDFLFISIARDRFTIGEFRGSPRKQHHSRLKGLRNKLIDLEQIAKEKNAKIVLIGDIPKVCDENINYTHEVIRKGEIDKCVTSKQTSAKDRIGLNNLYISIAKQSRFVIYVDPHDELCTEKLCSAVNEDGVMLYSDKSPHFTKDHKDILTNYWIKVLSDLKIVNVLSDE